MQVAGSRDGFENTVDTGPYLPTQYNEPGLAGQLFGHLTPPCNLPLDWRQYRLAAAPRQRGDYIP